MLLHIEISFQNVPEPANYTVIIVKPTIVLGVSSEIAEINRRVVAGDESLEFRRREHRQPLGIDDGTEAPNKRGRLFANLRMPAKGKEIVR